MCTNARSTATKEEKRKVSTRYSDSKYGFDRFKGGWKLTLWHTLNHILQTLAQVVRISQARPLVQHDIDFDVEFITDVVCL
jgi:hypothetical protein